MKLKFNLIDREGRCIEGIFIDICKTILNLFRDVKKITYRVNWTSNTLQWKSDPSVTNTNV